MENNQNFLNNDFLVVESFFNKIEHSIKSDVNEKINLHNKSILYSYYSYLYFFLPKHSLVRVNDKNHTGYDIFPDKTFYIQNKKPVTTSLKYITKSVVHIVPVESISANLEYSFLNITLNLNNNFDSNMITLWMNPHECERNSLLSLAIQNELFCSKNAFATIFLKNGKRIKKSVSISRVEYQLSLVEKIVLQIHSPSFSSGFNVNIHDLSSLENKIDRIDLHFEVSSSNYDENILETLFTVNLLPIFNYFNDYSNTITANLLLSKQTLKHKDDKTAVPVNIISVYENGKKCENDGFRFKLKNKYLFDKQLFSLNYNAILPQINYNEEIKVYTFSSWTQNISLSDVVEISSNFQVSTNCKFHSVISKNDICNYSYDINEMLEIMMLMSSKNIFSKRFIYLVLKSLCLPSNDLMLIDKLVIKVVFNNETSELNIHTLERINIIEYDKMYFLLNIMCEFISINSIIYINKMNVITTKMDILNER